MRGRSSDATVTKKMRVDVLQVTNPVKRGDSWIDTGGIWEVTLLKKHACLYHGFFFNGEK